MIRAVDDRYMSCVLKVHITHMFNRHDDTHEYAQQGDLKMSKTGITEKDL